MLPVVQCWLHQRWVAEPGEMRFAWGSMAAAAPVRFLAGERAGAVTFLVASQVPHLPVLHCTTPALQVAWLAAHGLSWLALALHTLAVEGSDVMFRVWLPIVFPLLLLCPLAAAAHWGRR